MVTDWATEVKQFRRQMRLSGTGQALVDSSLLPSNRRQSGSVELLLLFTDENAFL
jgi:hypothetical protein